MAEAALAAPADEPEVDDLEPVEIEGHDEDLVGPDDEIEPALDAPAKPEEPEVVSAEDGFNDLKAQLAAEKAAREADAKARKDAESRVSQLERTSVESLEKHEIGQYHQVQHALDAVSTKSKITIREHAEALRAGDYEKASELQATMAEEAVALAQLRQNKAQWETYLSNPNRHQRQQQPQRQAAVDPVEAVVRANVEAGKPRAGEWIKNNSDYLRDAAKMEKLTQAHYSALGEGHKEETDAYFAHINKRLGIGKVSEEKKPVERRVQPAAPTSRSASPASAPSKTTINLTPAQKRLCDDTGISYADYGANLVRAQRQGRIAART